MRSTFKRLLTTSTRRNHVINIERRWFVSSIPHRFCKIPWTAYQLSLREACMIIDSDGRSRLSLSMKARLHLSMSWSTLCIDQHSLITRSTNTTEQLPDSCLTSDSFLFLASGFPALHPLGAKRTAAHPLYVPPFHYLTTSQPQNMTGSLLSPSQTYIHPSNDYPLSLRCCLRYSTSQTGKPSCFNRGSQHRHL
jgi:hypothetical protein